MTCSRVGSRYPIFGAIASLLSLRRITSPPGLLPQGEEEQKSPLPLRSRLVRLASCSPMTRLDPITDELFRNAITALGDEMALTIYRTAYSGVLKNIMDYLRRDLRRARAGSRRRGSACRAISARSPSRCRRRCAHFGDDIAEGDILCINDPYDGGMHLPDIFVFKPSFTEARSIAYGATICHHTDVGGRVPGSNASDSTEIYAEGLRIPPLKLYERGQPNATLFRMIERNVRLPARVFGDLRSQLAACEIAARGMTDLVARHGADGVRR